MEKNFYKKSLARILLAGAAVLSLAACGSDNNSGGGQNNSSGKATKVTMLVLGDKPTNGRLENMLDQLNEKLTDKVNATLDLYYVEWADWQTQYNVQLLSGDSSIDLITTATDWLYGWENAQKGAFLPLSEDLLKENAPKTWEQVDEMGNWELTKLEDGEIYFIPEDNFTQYTNHGMFYRGDWAMEAGIPDGTITEFEQLTDYFKFVKENKEDVIPWDLAGVNTGVLDGYMAAHTDLQTLIGVNAGNYGPWQTKESDPYTITSFFMEGDAIYEAAEVAKEWNEIGVWREDVLNYDGDTRELFYAGQSGADQHHSNTFYGQITYNMNTKQPGSDPKFYYWGQESNNFFKDLKTHGAMAVSANSKHPEIALQVYDLLRNDEECYRLINYGIEGEDYIVTEDGKLDYPEGYDPSLDALGSNFWAGRMDDYELDKVTDWDQKWDFIEELNSKAKDYPYENLIFNKDRIEADQSAIANVLSEYVPQLVAGKFDDTKKAVDEMREKIKAAGYDSVRESLQADMDAYVEQHDLK